MDAATQTEKAPHLGQGLQAFFTPHAEVTVPDLMVTALGSDPFKALAALASIVRIMGPYDTHALQDVLEKSSLPEVRAKAAELMVSSGQRDEAIAILARTIISGTEPDQTVRDAAARSSLQIRAPGEDRQGTRGFVARQIERGRVSPEVLRRAS